MIKTIILDTPYYLQKTAYAILIGSLMAISQTLSLTLYVIDKFTTVKNNIQRLSNV